MNLKRKIVLASASPRRKELLERVDLVPKVIMPADIDEDINESDPEKLVMELSRLKAEAVAERFSGDEIIIGADTIVVCGAKILGKPKDREDAGRMIRLMSGRSHYVYTAVTMIFKGNQSEAEKSGEIVSSMQVSEKEKNKAIGEYSKSHNRVTFLEKTEVFLYPISEEEITDYVSTGDSDDKAGAYGIQGHFVKFVKEIKGDYHSVMGLPVARIYQELKAKFNDGSIE